MVKCNEVSLSSLSCVTLSIHDLALSQIFLSFPTSRQQVIHIKRHEGARLAPHKRAGGDLQVSIIACTRRHVRSAPHAVIKLQDVFAHCPAKRLVDDGGANV
jgi:hypothetical protein